MSRATFRICRGAGDSRDFQDFTIDIGQGMVVLDAVHQIQADHAPDLAVRWNCKAGKCGSCSAEINGRPRLMCMTRLEDLDLTAPVTVEPMRAFPQVLVALRVQAPLPARIVWVWVWVWVWVVALRHG